MTCRRRNRSRSYGKAADENRGGHLHRLVIRGLLPCAAMRMAQGRLLVIDGHRHVLARHAGLGHGRGFLHARLKPRACIARQRQLHEQHAEQCEKHCGEAASAKDGH